MDLVLLWWNVGLRPGIGKPAAHAKRIAVLDTILDSCKELAYDVIGLCEVSQDDIDYLNTHIHHHGFGVVEFQDKIGKLQFDMCILYRISKLSPIIPTRKVVIDSNVRRNKMKIGGSILFRSSPHGDLIYTICSHWPSRMNTRHAGSHIRQTLGRALKQQFEECIITTPYVILMGDYNDEPQDEAIFLSLEAGRDCGWSILNDRLYNPFWRHLGGSFSPASNGKATRHGSYFYSSWPQQDWWMFDQIMFSPAFLGLQNWILDERMTGILDISDLKSPTSTVPLSKMKVDHMPVFSRIVRN